MSDALGPLAFLYDNVEKQPEQIALIAGDASWSWQQVYQQSLRFASALTQEGLQPGDRVAYRTADNAEGFFMLWGVWLAGGVASPINGTLPQHIAEDVLKTLQPRFVLLGKDTPTFADREGMVQMDAQAVQETPLLDLPRPQVRPQGEAMVLFTSGSTGLPKGAVSTHQAIALNATRTAAVIDTTAHDRIMINTPHYYTSAISHLLALASSGGSVVIFQGFLFWETFAQEVQQHQCTGFGGAPSHFVRLFSSEPTQVPSSLRFLMSSGDHLPDHLAQYISERFPAVELFRIYGLTEVAGRLCILPSAFITAKPGSVGVPLPGMDVSVRAEDGATVCRAGEVGEIYVSGDMLSERYLGNEQATQRLHTPWGFRTGDFGFMDQDGFLSIQGRKDDVFKSGGEKVSCQLISEELLGLGIFQDVAVIARKDDLLGMIPVVYYVARDDSGFSKHEVIKTLRGKLPQSHVPRDFRPATTIPRTGSGKVDRTKLQTSAEQ